MADQENKKVVLAVDDMMTNLVTMQNILQSHFGVLLANTPEKALAFLDANKIDIILLDIEMPTMTGFEFLALIRKDPVKAKIPVIFVTAHMSPDFVSKAMSSGAEGYIVKPFLPDALIRRVNEVLEEVK